MIKKIVLLSTFFSGLTALAYQLFWQRYLSFLVGAEARSISLVVAIFLLGLASGYEFWGRRCHKIGDKSELLKLYGKIEIGIGLYAVLFPSYFKLLKIINYNLPSFFFLEILITIAAIFLPTFLMGATVPVLTTYLPEREEEVNRSHAIIYGINSLGAFIGIGVGLFLLYTVGLSFGHLLGAVNIIIGLYFYSVEVSGKTITPAQTGAGPLEKHSSGFLYILVAVSGAASLGLEVLLVRALGLSIGMSFVVFPIILSQFILGIAAGGLSVRKESGLLAKIGFNLFATILFFTIVCTTVQFWPSWLSHIRVSLNILEHNWYIFIGLVWIFTFVMLFPMLFFMGRLLPLAYNHLEKNAEDYGAKCGRMYFYNTIGTLVGSLLFGYLLLYVFNLDHLMKIIAVVLAAPLVYLMIQSRKITVFGVVGVVFAAVAILVPWNRANHQIGLFRQREYNPRLHGQGIFKVTPLVNANVIYHDDGPNTTVAVSKAEGYSLYVNGKSDGSTVATSDLGTVTHLATRAYIHSGGERPKVAVVGLGTGITAGLLGTFQEVDSVDLLEISPKVIETAAIMTKANRNLLKNKKIKIHQTDAFKFFAHKRSEGKYHAIVSEPSNPWVMGVENLYTPEFYVLAKQAMHEDGVLVQWLHQYSMDLKILHSVIKNLSDQFDHLELYFTGMSDLIFVATNSKKYNQFYTKRFYQQEVKNAHKKALFDVTHDQFTLLKAIDSPSLKFAAETFVGPYHDLDRPSIPHLAYKAFWLGKGAFYYEIVDPFLARLTSKEESKRYHRLFYRNKDEILKNCRIKLRSSAKKSQICVRMDKLVSALDKYNQAKLPNDKLKYYAIVRKEKILMMDKGMLTGLLDTLIERSFDRLTFELAIKELIKDGLFNEATDYLVKAKKSSLINDYQYQYLAGKIIRVQKLAKIAVKLVNPPRDNF